MRQTWRASQTVSFSALSTIGYEDSRGGVPRGRAELLDDFHNRKAFANLQQARTIRIDTGRETAPGQTQRAFHLKAVGIGLRRKQGNFEAST